MIRLKTKFFFIIVVAFAALNQCQKESTKPYTNLDIAFDNERAAFYLHTLFSEAENAWAFVDANEYKSFGPIEIAPSDARSYKKVIFNENTDTVTVEYRAWLSPSNLVLDGTLTVGVDTLSYRSSGKIARVETVGFAVGGQNVNYRATLQYKNVEEDANDQYTYNLLDGTAIYEKRNNAPLLITTVIRNGNYERTEGGDTFSHDDDVWKYWGVMTGMLREKPDMKYTNTVTPTIVEDGVTYDAAMYYEPGCITARQGLSLIEIKGRDNVLYMCMCSQIDFRSDKHKIR